MQCGFIKLHRQILDWEWYDDPNTMRLFLHCLLRANHKDNNWRGILIKKGSFLTSQIKLAEETGLTRQQVRTTIKKLISTNEVTMVTNAQHTVITILNWDSYQEQPAKQPTDNQLATNEQPTDNQPVTTNKNDKNVKNEKNVKKKESVDYSRLLMSVNEIEEVKRIKQKNSGNKKVSTITDRMVSGLSKEFELARNKGMTNDDILTEWETRGWKSFKAEWIKESYGQQANNSDFSPAVQKTINNIMNAELD